MKATSPAFSFYPKDWLSDAHVRAMTLEEKGAYIDLLCLSWLEDGLPNNPSVLTRLLGTSEKRFNLLWSALSSRFQNDDGLLRQKRLHEEKLKQIAHREKQRENGSKGGRPRKDKTLENPSLSTGKPKKSFPSPSPSPSPLVSCTTYTPGTDVPVAPGLTVMELAESWNTEIARPFKLPAVTIPLSASRHRKAQLRITEHPDPDWWGEVLYEIEQSAFLRGDNHGTRNGSKPWRATFDWLVSNDTNAQKIHEQHYRIQR